jgi:hypothetical protein
VQSYRHSCWYDTRNCILAAAIEPVHRQPTPICAYCPPYTKFVVTVTLFSRPGRLTCSNPICRDELSVENRNGNGNKGRKLRILLRVDVSNISIPRPRNFVSAMYVPSGDMARGATSGSYATCCLSIVPCNCHDFLSHIWIFLVFENEKRSCPFAEACKLLEAASSILCCSLQFFASKT